jgi:hypothetical protein
MNVRLDRQECWEFLKRVKEFLPSEELRELEDLFDSFTDRLEDIHMGIHPRVRTKKEKHYDGQWMYMISHRPGAKFSIQPDKETGEIATFPTQYDAFLAGVEAYDQMIKDKDG